MGRIRRLPPRVSSRIAAGEVVERPASVVKELVENSFDAGARRIRIGIKAGGRDEISVSDDGSGIAPEDVEAAFDRYSTSKIDSLESLASLSTLGFRGEALAAIAAAAGELGMVTSTGRGAGTTARLEEGKLVEKKESGAPRGTTVRVLRLFSSLPARRKFLKSARAEGAEVLEVVIRESLARPDVAVTLTDESGPRLTTPGRGLASAVAAVHGAQQAKAMIEVRLEADGVKVEGLVSSGSSFRRTSQHVAVALNGRYVENPELRRAVRAGFGETLPEGAWPVAVLHIGVPGDRLDVNVHPRKLEVRMETGFDLPALVSRAVREALERSSSGREFRAPKRAPGRGMAFLSERSRLAEGRPRPAEGRPRPLYSSSTGSAATAFISRDAEAVDVRPPSGRQSRLEAAGPGGERAATREGDIVVIAQLFWTFFLAERGDDLFLVDQHTAHERVLYERLRGMGRPRPQALVEPVLVDLKPSERRAFDSHADALEALGFIVKPFGPATVRVEAVPAVLGSATAASKLAEILDDLQEGARTKDVAGLAERARKSAACRSAWMKGDAVAPAEFARVLKELMECDDPFRCPHGRPTVITLSKDWFEREFERK